MNQKLVFTNNVSSAIDNLITELGNPQIIIIDDVNTHHLVLPRLTKDSSYLSTANVITIKADDENKSLEEVIEVWKQLSALNATRKSIIVNIGGGVVSDLGGFAASTFKRGVRCINIPTTLLSAVDASVGGKTGINFNGLKNQIGTFSEPIAAIISTVFFDTLPQQEILSGYGEMLKHGLLEGSHTLNELLRLSPESIGVNTDAFLELLRQSVMVKQHIVEQDPTERGLRKVLNLGHTIGHAFEALALKRNKLIPHGYAVAWGLIVELVLSNMKLNFDTDSLHSFANCIKENFDAFEITCTDYPFLISAMRQDKKNASAEQINFTLLRSVGNPIYDCTATAEEIGAALDIYRDIMGLN